MNQGTAILVIRSRGVLAFFWRSARLSNPSHIIGRKIGRGQPLSFTLSFGEIPWFDEEGEIRRCDWLERNP